MIGVEEITVAFGDLPVPAPRPDSEHGHNRQLAPVLSVLCLHVPFTFVLAKQTVMVAMGSALAASVHMRRLFLSGLIFSPCRVEYVTVTPEGFRYRSHIFPTVNGLFRWFKDHYQDPVPGKKFCELGGIVRAVCMVIPV